MIDFDDHEKDLLGRQWVYAPPFAFSLFLDRQAEDGSLISWCEGNVEALKRCTVRSIIREMVWRDS